MAKNTNCEKCGGELRDDTVDGLCPRCLMALSFASRTMPEGEALDLKVSLSPEEMRAYFPQFEILECLGRGGMGVVYKARQKALDRLVAIKVLAGERQDDIKFARRFEREAKMLAQMSHPNIVTVHDFGETDGLYYLVMEYVDGVNLRDLLQDGKIDPKQALAIVPPICEALEYAHDKGVVHRDIKPENLLLDREGRVKIADFGIASLVGVEGERSGTPPYMAPEQAKGIVDLRADIYALGAVLYEMLTGERLGKDPLRPSRRVAIDVRLDEIVLRALDREPERRYQTASEFRTMVETIMATPLATFRPSTSRQQPSPPEAPPEPAKAPGILAIVLGVVGIIAIIALATGVLALTIKQILKTPKAPAPMPSSQPTPSGSPLAGRDENHTQDLVQTTPSPGPQASPGDNLTVSSAISALKSASPREMRPLLKRLAEVPATAELRDNVIAAVKPLLDDVDAGAMAFEVFSLWAGKEQVPDLIEFVRIAPKSPRGRQSIKLLSRMGDARAAEPLAACLTDFHNLRYAKAALAALGDIAKPAVLPFYHHADRHAREAARELLRSYKVTEDELFAESIKALSGVGPESRCSAMHELSTAKLMPDQRLAAARAIRPLVTDGESRVRDTARNAMNTLASPDDSDFLLELLASTDDSARQFATELLVRFKDARAAKPIAVLLSDSHKSYPAGKALISLGSAAEPAVIPYLRHEDPFTRKRAAEVLTEIGTSASLATLQTAAKDPDFFVKVAAERALNAIKSRSGDANGQP